MSTNFATSYTCRDLMKLWLLFWFLVYDCCSSLVKPSSLSSQCLLLILNIILIIFVVNIDLSFIFLSVFFTLNRLVMSSLHTHPLIVIVGT